MTEDLKVAALAQGFRITPRMQAQPQMANTIACWELKLLQARTNNDLMSWTFTQGQEEEHLGNDPVLDQEVNQYVAGTDPVPIARGGICLGQPCGTATSQPCGSETLSLGEQAPHESRTNATSEKPPCVPPSSPSRKGVSCKDLSEGPLCTDLITEGRMGHNGIVEDALDVNRGDIIDPCFAVEGSCAADQEAGDEAGLSLHSKKGCANMCAEAACRGEGIGLAKIGGEESLTKCTGDTGTESPSIREFPPSIVDPALVDKTTDQGGNEGRVPEMAGHCAQRSMQNALSGEVPGEVNIRDHSNEATADALCKEVGAGPPPGGSQPGVPAPSNGELELSAKGLTEVSPASARGTLGRCPSDIAGSPPSNARPCSQVALLLDIDSSGLPSPEGKDMISTKCGDENSFPRATEGLHGKEHGLATLDLALTLTMDQDSLSPPRLHHSMEDFMLRSPLGTPSRSPGGDVIIASPSPLSKGPHSLQLDLNLDLDLDEYVEDTAPPFLSAHSEKAGLTLRMETEDTGEASQGHCSTGGHGGTDLVVMESGERDAAAVSLGSGQKARGPGPQGAEGGGDDDLTLGCSALLDEEDDIDQAFITHVVEPNQELGRALSGQGMEVEPSAIGGTVICGATSTALRHETQTPLRRSPERTLQGPGIQGDVVGPSPSFGTPSPGQWQACDAQQQPARPLTISPVPQSTPAGSDHNDVKRGEYTAKTPGTQHVPVDASGPGVPVPDARQHPHKDLPRLHLGSLALLTQTDPEALPGKCHKAGQGQTKGEPGEEGQGLKEPDVMGPPVKRVTKAELEEQAPALAMAEDGQVANGACTGPKSLQMLEQRPVTPDEMGTNKVEPLASRKSTPLKAQELCTSLGGLPCVPARSKSPEMFGNGSLPGSRLQEALLKAGKSASKENKKVVDKTVSVGLHPKQPLKLPSAIPGRNKMGAVLPKLKRSFTSAKRSSRDRRRVLLAERKQLLVQLAAAHQASQAHRVGTLTAPRGVSKGGAIGDTPSGERGNDRRASSALPGRGTTRSSVTASPQHRGEQVKTPPSAKASCPERGRNRASGSNDNGHVASPQPLSGPQADKPPVGQTSGAHTTASSPAGVTPGSGPRLRSPELCSSKRSTSVPMQRSLIPAEVVPKPLANDLGEDPYEFPSSNPSLNHGCIEEGVGEGDQVGLGLQGISPASPGLQEMGFGGNKSSGCGKATVPGSLELWPKPRPHTPEVPGLAEGPSANGDTNVQGPCPLGVGPPDCRYQTAGNPMIRQQTKIQKWRGVEKEPLSRPGGNSGLNCLRAEPCVQGGSPAEAVDGSPEVSEGFPVDFSKVQRRARKPRKMNRVVMSLASPDEGSGHGEGHQVADAERAPEMQGPAERPLSGLAPVVAERNVLKCAGGQSAAPVGGGVGTASVPMTKRSINKPQLAVDQHTSGCDGSGGTENVATDNKKTFARKRVPSSLEGKTLQPGAGGVHSSVPESGGSGGPTQAGGSLVVEASLADLVVAPSQLRVRSPTGAACAPSPSCSLRPVHGAGDGGFDECGTPDLCINKGAQRISTGSRSQRDGTGTPKSVAARPGPAVCRSLLFGGAVSMQEGELGSTLPVRSCLAGATGVQGTGKNKLRRSTAAPEAPRDNAAGVTSPCVGVTTRSGSARKAQPRTEGPNKRSKNRVHGDTYSLQGGDGDSEQEGAAVRQLRSGKKVKKGPDGPGKDGGRESTHTQLLRKRKGVVCDGLGSPTWSPARKRMAVSPAGESCRATRSVVAYSWMFSKHRKSPDSGGLAGLSFIVTGFQQAAERRQIVKVICNHGGQVIGDDWPAAEPGTDSTAGLVDVVVADAERRTPKFLAAISRGVPVVRAQWILDCAAAEQLLSPDSKPSYLLRNQDQKLREDGLLGGLRVHLCAEDKFLDTFGVVLSHAGAQVLKSWEEPTGWNLPGCNPDIDIILYDLEIEGCPRHKLRKQLSVLKRVGRRMKIPVQDHEWAVDAIMEGRLPPGFSKVMQPVPANGSGSPPVNSAIEEDVQVEETTDELQEVENGTHSTAEPREVSPAPRQCPLLDPGPSSSPSTTTATKAPNTRLDLQANRRTSPTTDPVVPTSTLVPAGFAFAPQSTPRRGLEDCPAQRSPGPIITPPPLSSSCPPSTIRLVIPEEGNSSFLHPSPLIRSPPVSPRAMVPRATTVGPPHRFHPASPEPPQSPSTTTSTAGPQWWGAPMVPPAGCRIPAAPQRVFYPAFLLGGEVIGVRDCVEVMALPGEEQPWLMRIDTLREETPSDGRPRLLASGWRFYRPQETMFPVSGALPQVFSSDHYEERVALASILCKCEVLYPSTNPRLGFQQVDRGDHVYECHYHYDHVRVMLGVQPALGEVRG